MMIEERIGNGKNKGHYSRLIVVVTVVVDSSTVAKRQEEETVMETGGLVDFHSYRRFHHYSSSRPNSRPSLALHPVVLTHCHLWSFRQ